MLTCKFENGYEASLRHAVVDALVLRGSEILLVKRTGKLLEGGKWALPGGYVERDETLKMAVAREIKEETGFTVSDITLLTIRDNPDRPKEDRQNISFVYFCAATESNGNSDWEVDDLQWFPLSALPPKEQVAFDHYEDILLYQRYIQDRLSLPILT
jgi:8-oxo-dGTP diphosphatase